MWLRFSQECVKHTLKQWTAPPTHPSPGESLHSTAEPGSCCRPWRDRALLQFPAAPPPPLPSSPASPASASAFQPPESVAGQDTECSRDGSCSPISDLPNTERWSSQVACYLVAQQQEFANKQEVPLIILPSARPVTNNVSRHPSQWFLNIGFFPTLQMSLELLAQFQIGANNWPRAKISMCSDTTAHAACTMLHSFKHEQGPAAKTRRVLEAWVQRYQ